MGGRCYGVLQIGCSRRGRRTLWINGHSNGQESMPGKRSSPTGTAPVERTSGGADEVYDDGRLRVEHDNYFVACDGQTLKLPRAEFLILSRLTRSPQRVVSSEELWQHVWGQSRPYNYESLRFTSTPSA